MNRIYVNIAQPVAWRDGILEWVDLDLDYRVYLDGSYRKLDEDEFAQNSLRYRYPPEVIAHIQAACLDVESGLEAETYPFDHAQAVALYQRILSAEQAG